MFIIENDRDHAEAKALIEKLMGSKSLGLLLAREWPYAEDPSRRAMTGRWDPQRTVPTDPYRAVQSEADATL